MDKMIYYNNLYYTALARYFQVFLTSNLLLLHFVLGEYLGGIRLNTLLFCT